MADAHHLRPRASLFRQGLVAIVVFMAPVFVALYALAIPTGAWRLVMGLQVFAIFVVVFAIVAYFRVGIWVDQACVRERGFFGRVRTAPVTDIESTILANTFAEGGTEGVPQLFVRGHDGRTLVRMRGQFWTKENMDVVINALNVPHTFLDDAVSRKELQDDYPGLLYWFERRPVITALAFTAIVAVLGAVVLLLLNLLGISPE